MRIRPLHLLGMLAFATVVSGCFQTVGAALEATATPPGGIVIAEAFTATLPLPTAITPVLSATPTVAQLSFPNETATPSFPTGTAVTFAPTLGFSVVSKTPLPTYAPQSTYVPQATYTLPPTYTAPPTYTPLPTYTALPTLPPPLITPTPISVALAPANQSAGTQTQQALYAQATDILATVTAAAAIQQTTIATLQGTFIPPSNGGQPTPTLGSGIVVPPALNSTPTGPYIAVYVTATPRGTPGTAGSGAGGFYDAENCRYFVVADDRLIRIALRFNTNVAALSRANRVVNEDFITPDSYLTIPGCNSGGSVVNGTGTFTGPIPTVIIVIDPNKPAVRPTTAAGTSGGSVSGTRYVVREGDTLFGVASRYGVSVTALAQRNGVRDYSTIYIGQVLILP